MNTDFSKILANISDKDIGINGAPANGAKSIRIGARAVLFDAKKRVALVYESIYNHYKLPGGIVEPNESLEETLRRELKEEVGADIKNIHYIGEVQSHLQLYNEDCAQHYFIAEVDGKVGKSEWIDEEELHGCSIVWCDNVQAAIAKVESSSSKEYVHKFEKARELAGLRAARKITGVG